MQPPSTSAAAGLPPPPPAGAESRFTAIALDRRVGPQEIADALGQEPMRRYPYAVVVPGPVAGAATFVFDFGAIVTTTGVLGEAQWQAIEAATGARPLPKTAEEWTVAVSEAGQESSERTPRVGWDRVELPVSDPLLFAAVALLVAQSAALERYELAADDLLDETFALLKPLADERLPRGTRKLVERVGALMRARLDLARWFYLLNRPEEAWEDPRVARLYDDLSANLELPSRHEAMLHKLEAVERSVGTVIDLWQVRRSHALEWAIVVLIVVDIVLALFGVV